MENIKGYSIPSSTSWQRSCLREKQDSFLWRCDKIVSYHVDQSPVPLIVIRTSCTTLLTETEKDIKEPGNSLVCYTDSVWGKFVVFRFRVFAFSRSVLQSGPCARENRYHTSRSPLSHLKLASVNRRRGVLPHLIHSGAYKQKRYINLKPPTI